MTTPTPVHSKASVLYFDGFRVSQIVSKADQKLKSNSAEYTALEDTWQNFLQGKPGGTSSCSGFMDMATGGWNSLALTSLTDGYHVWTRCPQGIAAGSPAYLTYEFATGDSRVWDQANVVMLDWQGQMSGAIARGQVLTTTTTATGTGAQSGRNTGTTSATQTLVANVILVAATGSGSATIAVQESSDNAAGDAYATVSGMTGAFTTVGQARQYTFLGASETWHRTNVTAFSGFTDVTFLTFIGTAL